jgi:Mrp family chromosome partitioning ATPase/uncharacterized protein involved in exopolysaccharide biosynthesis
MESLPTDKCVIAATSAIAIILVLFLIVRSVAKTKRRRSVGRFQTRPSVRGYLRMAFRRKWALLIPFAAGLILIAPLWALTPSKYRAVAYLQRRDLAALRSAPSSLVSNEGARESVETIKRSIMTPKRLDEVLDRARLAVGLDETKRQAMYERLRNSVAIVTAAKAQGVDVIEVAVLDASPRDAKNIANAIADLYKEISDESQYMASKSSMEFLSDQQKKYRDEMLAAEAALEDYRKEHFTSLPEVTTNILNSLLALRTEETSRSLQLDDAEKRLEEVAKQLAQEPQMVQLEVTTERNPRVAELQALLSQNKTLLDALLVRLADEHPTTKQLRADIASTQKELDEAAQRLSGTERVEVNPVYQALKTEQQNIKREVQGADLALRDVRTRITFLDRQLKDLTGEDRTYHELVRHQAEKTEYYTIYNRSLMGERMRFQAEQSESGAEVVVLQYAIEPARPYYVPRVKLGLACIVGGIALGIALIFGLEFCDSSFRNMEDAAAFMDLPVLASVTAIPERRRRVAGGQDGQGSLAEPAQSVVLYHDKHGRVAEEIRYLRTRLLAMPGRPHVLAITSSLYREGRTTLALNLGAALCEVGDGGVIVVDGNIRAPGLHVVANIEPSAGLAEALQAGLNLDGKVYSTRMPGLDIMPCVGSLEAEGIEKSINKSFPSLIQKLRSMYAYVIIDTPPVLASSQACTLAAQADGALLLIELEKTSRFIARGAAAELVHSGAKVLACVLTKRRHDLLGFLYR